MELCGQQIPNACYFDCPWYNFRKIAEEVSVNERDIETVQAAGISESATRAAIAASTKLNEDIALRVRRIVGSLPQDRERAHPWGPDNTGIEPSAAAALPPIECCTADGIILITKGADVVEITREQSVQSQ